MEFSSVIPFTYGVTQAAGQAAILQQLRLDNDSFFQFNRLFINADDAVVTNPWLATPSLLIRDRSTGRAMMNEEIPAAALAGSAYWNNCRPYDVIFPPNGQFEISGTNLNTNVTPQIAFQGTKLFMEGMGADLQAKVDALSNKKVLPFWYLVEAVIPADGSTTVTLQMDADSSFELRQFTSLSDQDGTTVAFNQATYTVIITENTTGRQLMNTPMRQGNIAGTALFGNDLCVYPLFNPRTVLTFNFTDLSGNENTVQFVLRGQKFFTPYSIG